MKILNLSVVLVLAIQLSGCSHFIIHEEDSVPIVAAKVTGRSLGCILTLIFGCSSEWRRQSPQLLRLQDCNPINEAVSAL